MNGAVRALVLTALLSVGGCQSLTVPEGPITGRWGGTHVGLTLAPDGGSLDYDCAAGEIHGPLLPGRDGRFSASGTHTPGQGGPVREGEVPPRLPAFYSGEVRGETMTLLVRVPSRGIEIGPLTLRRGAEPVLFRCL